MRELRGWGVVKMPRRRRGFFSGKGGKVTVTSVARVMVKNFPRGARRMACDAFSVAVIFLARRSSLESGNEKV